MTDLLDTDFLEGLNCFDEFGCIYDVSTYLKQLVRYQYNLRQETLFYQDSGDLASIAEIKNEENLIMNLILDIRRCERKVQQGHESNDI